MYEINGKFGLVRLCRTNMSLRNTAAAAQPPFSFVGGGWHKCNSLYHFQRPHGVDNYLVFFSLTSGGCVRIRDAVLFNAAASRVLSDILHILIEASWKNVSNGNKNGGVVSSVLHAIEENYNEELNIAALAEEHFVSQQHLIRLFKTETGYTPYEYLKKHRLKKSLELLTYSDLPIEQIAKKVGFSGASNFIYQFRNEYGVTPSKYRKYFY